MKQVILAFTLVFMVGCVPVTKKPYVHKPFVKEMPTINVPVGMRQANWPGSVGQGSCVHASTISLFRWQGRLHTADYWRKTYGNGEWPEDLASKFDKEGIRYAYVTNGDAKFLEWCVRTRRGAAVTVMGGAHMVTLVHFDAKWAAILDNNNISKFKWMPRETFLAEWRASHGWAVTPIYTPAAPLPQ